MVVFACNQCGQSVKKNQVDKHCFQCRGCQSLSCMDCGKDFWGDDYKNHTKCISEDQKYGGKDFKPKPSSNKGEVKQVQWIEHIKNVIATKNLSGPLSSLLRQITEFQNIPRKRVKFENFIKNSFKITNNRLINEAWDIFAKSTEGESNVSTGEQMNVNGSTNNMPNKRTSDFPATPSKKICVESSGSFKENKIGMKDVFKWSEVMERLLQNSSEKAMPLRKLRKQVFAEYIKFTGGTCSMSGEEFKKKFKAELSNEKFCLYKSKGKDME